MVVPLRVIPKFRRNINNTIRSMDDKRIKTYAAWWRERDAEVYNIISTHIVLRRHANGTSSK